MKPLFIHSVGHLSAVASLDSIEDVASSEFKRLRCVEPAYEEILDPRSLRRMSRILKMGAASALTALKAASLSAVDAIISGTGYGCLDDTSTFLLQMLSGEGQMLNPTPFIQSTHNAIGSQIAMILKCHGYNQTITHRSLSFEHALIDANLYLIENRNQTALVGAADELTDLSFNILTRFSAGGEYLFGEGSNFFVMSVDKTNAPAMIADVATWQQSSDISREVLSVLRRNQLEPTDIDLILDGSVGHCSFDCESLFSSTPIIAYKRLCGEFPSASAFATALGFSVLKSQKVPTIVDPDKPVKWVMIYNVYFGTQIGIILLRSC